MIEAQEAALEGAHVAVPEGLVPAMTTVMAEVYRKPPCQNAALSDLPSLVLTVFLGSFPLASPVQM